MNLTGQKIAILGCGRSGAGAAGLACREGAVVSVFDSGEKASFAMDGVQTYLGADAATAEIDYDLAVISPGIDLASDLARRFTGHAVPIIGELEFAYRLAGEIPIVGITGTNGKTTTTELVETILSKCGQRSVAAGNYGVPLSEVLTSGEAYDVFTIEISSFQLEAIEAFRCEIAVWLNFAPDHLDRYPGVEEYRAAKLRLFENQTAADWAILEARESFEPGTIKSQTLTFSAHTDSADYTLRGGVEIVCPGGDMVDMRGLKLRGMHNAENLMAALAVGHIRGLETAEMVAAVAEYTPPRHRCELVRNLEGVDFINDSKATNLHALESSLVAQGGVPLVLIAGGKEKGLPFQRLRKVVAQCATNVVLIGEIRERVSAEWGDEIPCKVADSVEEAVALSRDLAEVGGAVLFSPGTSSFDMFSGYAERGDAFCRAVNELT
ncbi:MAG: UDP-N-acetylmuramoylalanine--D-glutamate ligase [Pseudoalteromonas tetraodonis]|jgi:UDP-N-acetylmuramoylalanine--D-glutamate ligase